MLIVYLGQLGEYSTDEFEMEKNDAAATYFKVISQ
jgi:hypothetical protein